MLLFLGLSGSVAANPNGRIFFLDLRGKLVSATPEGADRQVLIDGLKGQPDGIAVDVDAGHVYWSNMGRANDDDGSIERVDIDGRNVTTIVPAGGTLTAKQLKLDKANGKLYWADREGMRIQRANIDGSNVETLVSHGTRPRRAMGREELVRRHRRRRQRRKDLLDAKGERRCG